MLPHASPCPMASEAASSTHLVRYTLAPGRRPWIASRTPHTSVHRAAASQTSFSARGTYARRRWTFRRASLEFGTALSTIYRRIVHLASVGHGATKRVISRTPPNFYALCALRDCKSSFNASTTSKREESESGRFNLRTGTSRTSDTQC